MNYFAHMKPFILFGSSIMIIAVLIPAVAFISKKNEIPEKHVEIVLRDIGHQLLLSAKDSSSRVLPVKKLNDHTYQIYFQNDFGFISDTLINLVQRTFQKNALANGYIVHLRNCKQNETVFAFEINSQAGDLTPCGGRCRLKKLFLTLFTFKFRKGLSIITLLSSRLCEGHVYKLFYYLVLHSRPILLDMNTWARAIRYGFL